MRINLLRRRALVQADEPMQQVVASGIVVVATLVVGEVVGQGRAREFLGEEIDFVEEEDL
jgi:hypothetical protein